MPAGKNITPKARRPLEIIREENDRRPLKERVPYLDTLLDAGTITQGEYVWLSNAAIGAEIDKAIDKNPRQRHSINRKLFRELGSDRLGDLYLRSKDAFFKLCEEGRQSWLAEQQQKRDQHHIDKLAADVVSVLQNPACPQILFNGIANALAEVENHADTLSPSFLTGLLLAPSKGGAQ